MLHVQAYANGARASREMVGTGTDSADAIMESCLTAQWRSLVISDTSVADNNIYRHVLTRKTYICAACDTYNIARNIASTRPSCSAKKITLFSIYFAARSGLRWCAQYTAIHGPRSPPFTVWQTWRVTGRLHGTIVGPTDPGYVRLSVRPVGQTGRTDCSRTAHICQSNQCGLLADYNTAYAAAWLVVRLAGRSDQSDVVSTRFDSLIGSRTKSNIRPSVRPVERSVYTIRSSDRPVGQTSRTDNRTVRPVGQTGRSDDRTV